MIISLLKGGMGNQMFEYAFAKSLSLEYNIPFKMDQSFLLRRDLGDDFVYRNYDLDLFQVDENFIENQKLRIKTIIEPHFHYSKEVLAEIKKILNPSIFKRKSHLLLDGYWQSPLYFNKYEKEIRNDFSFKNTIENSGQAPIISLLEEIRETNSIMINVRRADYLNTDFHGVLGTDFIEKGVAEIRNQVENPKFYVFSDDVEWCKENIKLDNMKVVSHDYKGDKFGYYLQLMKACKHFIIPNSTFAWWAAWLNENPKKIVIAPKLWFSDQSINTNDIIPKGWKRI